MIGLYLCIKNLKNTKKSKVYIKILRYLVMNNKEMVQEVLNKHYNKGLVHTYKKPTVIKLFSNDKERLGYLQMKVDNDNFLYRVFIHKTFFAIEEAYTTNSILDMRAAGIADPGSGITISDCHLTDCSTLDAINWLVGCKSNRAYRDNIIIARTLGPYSFNFYFINDYLKKFGNEKIY